MPIRWSRSPTLGVLVAVTLVFLVTTALAAAVLEGVLRWMIPGSDVDLFEFTTETPRFKVMRRNVRGQVYGVPFETNEWGFRDARSWSTAKRDREFRVVMLGDSVTVAAGVAFEDTYGQVVEALLQRRFVDRSVQVMNLGVGGYDIVQYLHVFREVGRLLKPDHVTVGVFPTNDFDGTNRRRSEALAERVRTGVASWPAPPWYDSLYVYRAYVAKLIPLAGRYLPSVKPAGGDGHPPRSRRRPSSPENRVALLSLAALAREAQIPLVIAVLPDASDLASQRPQHQEVMAVCAEHGLACVDMLDAFLASGVPGRRFRLNVMDDHPNAAYNRIVGERLAAYLTGRVEERGLASSAAE
jgi:lysophospholipase L1-like esterase